MSARLRDAPDLDDTDPESYRRCKSVNRMEHQREKSPETPKQKNTQTVGPAYILSQLSMSNNTSPILIFYLYEFFF